MSNEYERAREHWQDELLRLITIGFQHGTSEELDKQFELCVMLYEHMNRQRRDS